MCKANDLMYKLFCMGDGCKIGLWLMLFIAEGATYLMALVFSFRQV